MQTTDDVGVELAVDAQKQRAAARFLRDCEKRVARLRELETEAKQIRMDLTNAIHLNASWFCQHALWEDQVALLQLCGDSER